MLRRVLQLGLEIDWRRVTPVLLLTALAAILPVGAADTARPGH
jgi:hypothetical protein